MGPSRCFYELGLVVLGWLFLMRSWLWPHDPATRSPTRPHPRPPRKPSTGPQPLAGLTQRPHGALGAQDAMVPQALPSAPPEPLAPPPRRPRRVDTSRHFCPQPAVTIAAGWGEALCAPMGIPMGALSDHASVPRARAIFRSIMARAFMGSRSPWRYWSGCGHVWPRAEAFAPPPGCPRWLPTPGLRGGWKPPSRCVPCPGLSSVRGLSTKGHSTRGPPSSVPSKTARSGQPRPSNALRARRIGCGRRWHPQARCSLLATGGHGRWPWPEASCIRWGGCWPPPASCGCCQTGSKSR
jgi:hypothetical protein